MAILKHIASKNADYTETERYLTFQHDENTGRLIRDEEGYPIPREKYFDNLSYQIYLRTFSIGNGDNDEKRRNHNNVQRSRKKSRIKKDKK